MRAAIHKEEFTPFGLWLKEYVSAQLTVTNIDYLLLKAVGDEVRVMFLEEKTNNGRLGDAQVMAMRLTHAFFVERTGSQYDLGEPFGIKTVDYWGFYLLAFGEGRTMPGPGMRLNSAYITVEQLQSHLSFYEKFTEGNLRTHSSFMGLAA